MSSLTWLDYSDGDRRRMLDVVDLFRERDTRDELGLGSVRDAFADTFFPGTSTIMTRARYFLLVPWIYTRLEAQGIGSAEIAKRARQAELDLVGVIAASSDDSGNIGKLAQRTLKRLPSSVYWQGLGAWGIRTFDGAQSQYHRGFDRHTSKRNLHHHRSAERDAEPDEVLAQNWHGGLIKPPADFTKNSSLSLSRTEAEYLCDRIRFSPACSRSLLAALVALGKQLEPSDFVWEHPVVSTFNPEIKHDLEHARNFSEAMHGAVILYNLMLAEQTERDELVESLKLQFATWCDVLTARQDMFSRWDRDRFWQTIDRKNPRVRKPTRDFITTWCDWAAKPERKTLRNNTQARGLVSQRERQLKKNLARINNPQTRHLWKGSSGMDRMDFRWDITQDLLSDIFQGLEAPDA